VAYTRERWETPDGDFIDLDWLAPPTANPSAPLLVLFHGLEGSSRSHYAAALMHDAQLRGWRGVVVHFRGCSGEPNRFPRAYHSGDSAEVDWILRRLRERCGNGALYAAGVSLGANALLRWLGEQQEKAAAVVSAAAAVSAPVDLMAAGNRLDSGLRIYTRNFLWTMKRKALAKLERHPGAYPAPAVRGARTLREFDNLVTAPLHGYRDTDDYWTRASSKPLLRLIAVPTLLINARNDPFLPAEALPAQDDVSRSVELDFPQEGGHAGFVTGSFPGALTWMPRRLARFFGHPDC
jgi:predicted alpha/beta-fold hydrolase